MNSVLQNYRIVGTGAISGETSPTALPAVNARYVKFKAQVSNSGNVYIGITSGVTVPTDSTTDATSGFELDAGQETDWLPCPGGKLSGFYIDCDNAGDDLTYIALG